MRKVKFLLLCSLVLTGVFVVEAQKAGTPKLSTQEKAAATAEREIKGFFDAYGEDLRLARREAIADRYDRRGYYRLGNGNKR